MTSKSIIVLLLQSILISSQLQDVLCYPRRASTEDISHSKYPETQAVQPTIFDSSVLNRVKTLFTRSLQSAETSTETGQKKSIITTAEVEKSLHVKIDPREFGNVLLNQANQNAARKSDIYLNKAIDATALGQAVLKLIFGKDAKMVMKDAPRPSEDTKPSLRTKEPRPKITSWAHSAPDVDQTGEKKSLNTKMKWKGSDKVGKLNMNILKLVKSLQTSGITENGETKSVKDNSGLDMTASQDTEKSFSGSESNIEQLLSLMKESKPKEESGSKKSWVLLKVPSKQPHEELGMLNDPAVTEENSKHDDSQQGHTRKIHENTVKTQTKHHKHHSQNSKENSNGLITNIQKQVKHLADLVTKQTSKETESLTDTKHRIEPEKPRKQQSFEGKSFTASRKVASKTLKTEPFQEANPVKSDTTADVSYDNSVRNLLKALETSSKNRHVSREVSHLRPRHHKIELVPLKKQEEHASSKDVLGGTNPAAGAVVSLDALRQLGQLLGLSSQHAAAEEKKISPYTGTEDTLTLATAMPPDALKTLQQPTPTPVAPTIPPVVHTVPPPSPSTPNLNRISEQLKMFAERGLRGHNDYRRLHHAEPLKWSEDLATTAEKLAYQAAKQGTTKRSELVEKKGYGENVAKIPKIVLENAGEEATRHWYNEKQNFTFSDPVVDEGTKAFTQMIWKGTQTLGMGAAKDDDTGEIYVVALYSPKGNDQATLRENLVADGQKHFDVYASIFKKSYAPPSS